MGGSLQSVFQVDHQPLGQHQVEHQATTRFSIDNLILLRHAGHASLGQAHRECFYCTPVVGPSVGSVQILRTVTSNYKTDNRRTKHSDYYKTDTTMLLF